MKKAASIFLRSELLPADIRKLGVWMRSRHVTRYLNEDARLPETLEELARTTPAPLLSGLFNRQGRFFLICAGTEEPIGFLKMKKHDRGCFEIVFAIGEETLWGKGYGSAALRAAEGRAFLDWRAEKLIANVCHDNHRSLRAVCRCGFREERRMENLSRYSITMEDYLRLMRGEKTA